jgi:hypothetical protein
MRGWYTVSATPTTSLSSRRAAVRAFSWMGVGEKNLYSLMASMSVGWRLKCCHDFRRPHFRFQSSTLAVGTIAGTYSFSFFSFSLCCWFFLALFFFFVAVAVFFSSFVVPCPSTSLFAFAFLFLFAFLAGALVARGSSATASSSGLASVEAASPSALVARCCCCFCCLAAFCSADFLLFFARFDSTPSGPLGFGFPSFGSF